MIKGGNKPTEGKEGGSYFNSKLDGPPPPSAFLHSIYFFQLKVFRKTDSHILVLKAKLGSFNPNLAGQGKCDLVCFEAH